MAHSLLEEEDEALKETEGITEIIKLDPSRMDGVFAPANGAPFLLVKSIANDTGGAAMTATATETETITTEEAATDTGTDEAAKAATAEAGEAAKDSGGSDGEEDEGAEGETDDDGGAEADAGAAKAAEPEPHVTRAAIKAARGAYETARREYEATEPTTKGALDGTDVLRARAEWNTWRALGKSQGLDGTEDGRARWVAKHLADEAAPELDEAVIKAEVAVYKRTFTTEQRRKAADAGHALADGSYPIENTGDLDNAAILAASGHGNVSGAKRLIARRAKELGVANPLDSKDGDDSKTSKGAEPAVAEDATATEAEALLDPETAITKAMAAGLISRQVADSLLAKVRRDLPASTQPVAAHREPDGAYVEAFERDAGLPSDSDGKGDKIPAPVAEAGTIPPANASTDIMAERVGKQVPYSLQRMHDALCPAYDEADVLGAYPALKSVMDAVGSSWLREQAMAKQAAGKTKKAARLAELAASADQLKTADPAALADARASLRKAFTDAYPDTKIRPQSGMSPGSFHRPWITAGHEANSPAVTGTQATTPTPPSMNVPEPQQFQRGNLTAGHEAPSPGDHGPNNPHPPGSSGNEYYSASEQMMASAAMRSIHDHIQATFAGCCPMAPARHALPTGLGMGASNSPETKVPMSMGGIPTVGKAAEHNGATVTTVEPQALADLAAALAQLAKTTSPDDDSDSGDSKAFGGNQAPPFGKPKKKKGAKKEMIAALKEAAEAGAAAALAAMKDTSDGAAVQAIVAEQLRTIGDRYDSQISSLTKQVEELGSQPDPAQAPVRGQMSRPESAAPVEKRSLIDEHRAAKAAQVAAEREAFTDYVRMQAQSADPKIRSRAEEVLRTIPAP